MQPAGERTLELVIQHAAAEKREILPHPRTLGHLTHPMLFHLLVPRTPIALVHGCAGRHLERHAHAIHLQNVLIFFQHLVHETDGLVVLHLVIHVEHSQFPSRIMFAEILDAQKEQHTAVLPPRERHVHIVEILEHHIQADLNLLVHIQFLGFRRRSSILTYTFHVLITSNLCFLKTSISRICTTACTRYSLPKYPNTLFSIAIRNPGFSSAI